jgi:hypothetical protein
MLMRAEEVVSVKGEVAFRDFSLVLFTLPVDIWTMMPADDPAYTFIGLVEEARYD